VILKETIDEIITIGAGPAGLFASEVIAKKNINVTIFEEHKKVGIPLHCSGLLSVSGLKLLGEGNPNKPYVLNSKIKGAIFYSPSGISFEVMANEVKAFVVDRTLFDQEIAYRAQRAGVTIKPYHRVVNILRKNNSLKVIVENLMEKKKMQVITPIVIDAEGRSARLRTKLGLTYKLTQLPAYQYVVENVIPLNVEQVELFFDTRIAKNFFAWIIPIDETMAKVGLATAVGNPKANLDLFMSRPLVAERFKQSRIQYGYGGSVVTSGPIRRIYDNNLLVVGDAAGHVKPTTGGGVVLGGLCAKFAGNIAANATLNGKFDKSYLSLYQTLCVKKYGREFKSMKLARQWLNMLSNKGYDKLFRYIKSKELEHLFVLHGDMDFQESAIKRVLKNPVFLIYSLYLSLLSKIT